MADRIDMIETQQDSENNTVSVFGYVRGTYLDKHQRIHVNGLGDFDIKNVQKMDDPCPIELKKTVKQKQAEHEAEKQGLIKPKKKRNLKDKEKVLYAPYTNIGAVNFENTTGYINIPDQNVVYTRLDEEDADGQGHGLSGVDASNVKELNEGQKMVFSLQDAEKNRKQIDDMQIEEPQLLTGVKLNGTSDKLLAQKMLNNINLPEIDDFNFKNKIS